MTSAKVKQPILRLEILRADGTTDAECRVFCRLKHHSVPVDQCCACVHCDAITEASPASPATVDCTIPEPPLLASDDPTGEHIEVGTLLHGSTVVVADGATLRAALTVLRAEDRRAVAVVDDAHMLVGLVHETSLVVRAVGPLARDAAIASAMSTPLAVHESTPVRVALRMLAGSHLREATVIADDGTPLGVFRDVDGLQWITAARAPK